jgi:iron-regulated transporter 1
VVDLTVSQLLQETVEEDVRGVINGVQDSMNNTLDLAKCLLVILLPAEETFGLLIFASFASINFG